MSWGVGDVPFDLDDGKVALNNGDGTFATAIDIFSIQMVGMTIKYRTGQATGDGGITAQASIIESIEGKIKFAGVQRDILALVTGLAKSDTASTPNRIQGVPITVKRAPYIGLQARALSSETGGADAHIFIPHMKNMSDITINFTEKEMVTVEMTFSGTADQHLLIGGVALVADIYQHETAAAITSLPPADRAYTIAA